MLRCQGAFEKGLVPRGHPHLSPELQSPIPQDVHNLRLFDVNLSENDSTLGPKSPPGDAMPVKLPNSTGRAPAFIFPGRENLLNLIFSSIHPSILADIQTHIHTCSCVRITVAQSCICNYIRKKLFFAGCALPRAAEPVSFLSIHTAVSLCSLCWTCLSRAC